MGREDNLPSYAQIYQQGGDNVREPLVFVEEYGDGDAEDFLDWIARQIAMEIHNDIKEEHYGKFQSQRQEKSDGGIYGGTHQGR